MVYGAYVKKMRIYMDIIQTFYDNLATQYDKLFQDWEETTKEQALILDKIFKDKG